MKAIQVWGGIILFGALIAVPSIAAADSILFHTSDSPFKPGVSNQGSWADRPAEPPLCCGSSGSGGYFAGFTPEFVLDGTPILADQVFRNFFTFDLSQLSGTAISAQLEVTRLGYRSPNPSETLGLFGVSTDAATLNNTGGLNTAIFADLGSGTTYGSFTLNRWGDTDAERSVREIFPLNPGAINAINAAAGGFFSIGGALQGILGGDETQGVFFRHFEGPQGEDQILRVETVGPVQPVPEPSAILLLGLGLAGLVSFRRQQLSRR